MGYEGDEFRPQKRQGVGRKCHELVVVYRGGIFRAWFEGRGFAVGFGKNEKEAIAALKGLS